MFQDKKLKRNATSATAEVAEVALLIMFFAHLRVYPISKIKFLCAIILVNGRNKYFFQMHHPKIDFFGCIAFSIANILEFFAKVIEAKRSLKQS